MSMRSFIRAGALLGSLSVAGPLSFVGSVSLISSLALIGSATPAGAASKTIDLKAVQDLAAGLGLEDSSDKKSFVRAENQGSQNYTVWLTPADEQTTILIYTYLADIPKDKLSGVPMEQMLEYNDSHPSYFTISDVEGEKRIYLQYRLAAPAVTPQAVRASIDGLLAAADETKDLWTAEKWKTAALDTEKPAAAFATQKVMFVTQKTNSYGNYSAKSSNVFAPGEKLMSYIEPVGYGYKEVATGTYQFGVAIDFELRTKDGKILGGQQNFSTQNLTSHEKVKEFFLDLTLSLSDIPAGDYVLAYTLHDTSGTQTTRFEQPFTIKTASSQ